VAAPEHQGSQVISMAKSQVTGCIHDHFLVAAHKTQAANAADCFTFTVKIKQIKPPDMVTFLFSVRTITEAKQGRAEPERWIFQPGHLTWRALA